MTLIMGLSVNARRAIKVPLVVYTAVNWLGLVKVVKLQIDISIDNLTVYCMLMLASGKTFCWNEIGFYWMSKRNASAQPFKREEVCQNTKLQQ